MMTGLDRTTAKRSMILGVIALVPFAILALLLFKVYDAIRAAAKPLGVHSAWVAVLAVLGAVLLVAIVCLALGALIQTRFGSQAFARLEDRLLKRVPGYDVIANLLRGFAGDVQYRPALVTLYGPGSAVFGFVMEENDNGTLTVFIPASPAMTVGTVHILLRDRVNFLAASLGEVSACLGKWGVGAGKLLAGERLPPA